MPPSRSTVCAEIARRPLLKVCAPPAGPAVTAVEATGAGGRATPPPPPRGRVSRLEGGGCWACLPAAAQGLPRGECCALFAPAKSLMRPTSSSSEESPSTLTTRTGLLPGFRADPTAAAPAPAPTLMPGAELGECTLTMRGARLEVPSSWEATGRPGGNSSPRGSIRPEPSCVQGSGFRRFRVQGSGFRRFRTFRVRGGPCIHYQMAARAPVSYNVKTAIRESARCPAAPLASLPLC